MVALRISLDTQLLRFEMSGVLRRGSLSFDCRGNRGSLEANLYGGYRETRPGPKTPEISVIALDFRRYSEDLKKPSTDEVTTNKEVDLPARRDLSQDVDSDVISNFLGHYTRWSFLWTLLLCLFQLPTTFHLFMFVFQVSFGFMARQIFVQLIASPKTSNPNVLVKVTV